MKRFRRSPDRRPQAQKEDRSGQIFEVRIERIVPKGLGIGFTEGSTVFVPLSAPGDLLRVRANQIKGKTVFAEIVDVIEPSSDRMPPKCGYFGQCGGCDFQHLTYEAQLFAKSAIVRDCFKRIGKIEIEEIPIVPSPQQFGYRSRAQWHADTRSRRIGYFKRGSHEIIEAGTCPILVPELESTLTAIREDIDWDSFWAENLEFEAASSGDQVSIFSEELIEPTHEIDFCVNENRYTYDARSFFQGNQLLIGKLTELAVGGLSGAAALDLYCGVGLFTLPLARAFGHVTGVESGERAVAAARRNLENSGLANADIVDSGVGDWLRAETETIGAVDLIVLDPPRSGTEKETIAAIVGIAPKAISYVSCEPATLARDLRVLVDGGYAIESVTALDLFPQTHHVETVVRLRRLN